MAQPSEILTFQNYVTAVAKQLRRQDFLTYFHKVSFLGFENGVLTVGVVSEFVRDNMMLRFSKVMTQSAWDFYNWVTSVDVVIDKDIDVSSYSSAVDCRMILRSVEKKTTKKTDNKESSHLPSQRDIQERYTFDNFIVGACNQLAHAACEAVARKPGSAYNPLFIYSSVGLGKTHLLQATANEIKRRSKWKKVIYTTSDRFVTEYVHAVKMRKIESLRQRYQNVDVLVIDDIQFLAGKKQTQEELYVIFNSMYDAGKQVILSSDRPPRELTQIEPRLINRFEMGIMVDIDEPDFETKLAILQQKAREKGFIIPQEVAEYICYNIGKSIRELEWILNQMVAEFEFHGTPPTIESVSKRFDRLAIKHNHIWAGSVVDRLKINSYKDVLSAVSDHFGVELEGMLGDGRTKELMIPRQVAMYLLKNRMNFTYDRIGNIFNGRQHSAVMYACRKLEEMLGKDQKLYYELNVVRDRLGL